MREREPWRKWVRRLAGVATLLLAGAAVGCRLPPPNLKPPDGPEELNLPPSIARYDNPEWPKQVMDAATAPRQKQDTAGGLKSPSPGGVGGMAPTGMGGRPGQ